MIKRSAELRGERSHLWLFTRNDTFPFSFHFIQFKYKNIDDYCFINVAKLQTSFTPAEILSHHIHEQPDCNAFCMHRHLDYHVVFFQKR